MGTFLYWGYLRIQNWTMKTCFKVVAVFPAINMLILRELNDAFP